MPPTFAQLVDQARCFRDQREWRPFHTPRQLGAALAIEAAELQQELLWKTDREVTQALDAGPLRQRLGDELADVLLYAIYLADAAGVDLLQATSHKLARNEQRYPRELCRGSAGKPAAYSTDE